MIGQTPTTLPAGGGPLSTIRLTFDEPLDVATLDASDFSLQDPQGSLVPLTVTAVPGTGNTQFDLAFANQSVRGTYRLRVSTNVSDASGKPTNQDGDPVKGGTADAYQGTVTFAPTSAGPPSAPPVLYAESFESWSPVPSDWAFETLDNGKIATVTSGGPHGGVNQLRFSAPSSYCQYQSAVLAVDLSAYGTDTDLNLEFWAKYADSAGTLYVDLSADGTPASWQNVATLNTSNGLGTGYAHFPFDLDSLAASRGIARDAGFYVRFRDYNSYSLNHALFVDDVRITKKEFPHHAPTLTTITTLTGATENQPFTITFADLAAAANEADFDNDPLSFRIELVSNGTLTKGGGSVMAGTTLLGAGESLIWTPKENTYGVLDLFTVRAWDGDLTSGEPVLVKANVATIPYRAFGQPSEPLDLIANGPGVGKLLDNANDAADTIDLGANTFTFYGASFSGANRLFVSSNGIITFETGTSSPSNSDLISSPSQKAIAVFWDDWVTNADAADAVLHGSVSELYVINSQSVQDFLGFDDTVVHAAPGTGSTAYVYDDPTRIDTLFSIPYETFRSGTGSWQDYQGFDTVVVYGTQGTGDLLYLYDSAGSDRLQGPRGTPGDWLLFNRNADRVIAQGVDRVVAIPNTGIDELDLDRLMLEYALATVPTENWLQI